MGRRQHQLSGFGSAAGADAEQLEQLCCPTPKRSVITCQSVASVQDLHSFIKWIAKCSNFIKQRKNQLRGKWVTLSRKLLLMLICYLSTSPHALWTCAPFCKHVAWLVGEQGNNRQKLDSVPSFTSSRTPCQVPSPHCTFVLSRPHPFLNLPTSFTFPFGQSHSVVCLSFPHPYK